MWVLGIKARASGRAAIAFSCWEIFPAQRMMEMLWTLCTVNFHCQPSYRTWELETGSVTSRVQSSGSKVAVEVWNLSPALGSKNTGEPRVCVLKGLWMILEHWPVMFCDLWFGVSDPVPFYTHGILRARLVMCDTENSAPKKSIWFQSLTARMGR